MDLMDKRMGTVQPVVTTLKNEMKELKSKYCPLYELRMASQIEDVNPDYSLAVAVQAEKTQHIIKMEKLKAL